MDKENLPLLVGLIVRCLVTGLIGQYKLIVEWQLLGCGICNGVLCFICCLRRIRIFRKRISKNI